MRKTLPLAHNDRFGWHVDMPTYAMVAGTFGPAVANVIHPHGIPHGTVPAEVLKHAPYVTVELPEDTPLDLFGNVDAAAMRHRYRGHPRFGSDTWHPPKEVKA